MPGARAWTALAGKNRLAATAGRPGQLSDARHGQLGAVDPARFADRDAPASAARKAFEPDSLSAAAGALRFLLRDAAPGDLPVSVYRVRRADGLGGAFARACGRGLAAVAGGVAVGAR